LHCDFRRGIGHRGRLAPYYSLKQKQRPHKSGYWKIRCTLLVFLVFAAHPEYHRMVVRKILFEKIVVIWIARIRFFTLPGCPHGAYQVNHLQVIGLVDLL